MHVCVFVKHCTDPGGYTHNRELQTQRIKLIKPGAFRNDIVESAKLINV